MEQKKSLFEQSLEKLILAECAEFENRRVEQPTQNVIPRTQRIALMSERELAEFVKTPEFEAVVEDAIGLVASATASYVALAETPEEVQAALRFGSGVINALKRLFPAFDRVGWRVDKAAGATTPEEAQKLQNLRGEAVSNLVN